VGGGTVENRSPFSLTFPAACATFVENKLMENPRAIAAGKGKVMHETIQNPRKAPLLLALCFAIYCAQYLGRYCLSACLASMAAAEVFTRTELGTVATCFFASYALMQIPGGVLGDRLRASRLAGIGVGGSALITLIFPSVGNIALLRVLWLTNGILQALVWPALMHIVSDVNFGSREGEKPLMSVVTLTYSGPAGVLMSYGLCALLLRRFSYEGCFRTAGCAMCVIVALWFLLAVPMLEKDGSRIAAVPADNGEKGREKTPWKALLLGVLPLLTVVSFLHGLLKDGLTTWVPTYLTETLFLGTDRALLLTMLLPIANFGGIYVADLCNRRLFRNEMTSTAFCFGVTLLCLGLMIFAFSASVLGTVVCFAGVSLLMTAVNTLVISMTPQYFDRFSAVSTVTGVLDAAIYLGSALSTSLFAAFAEAYGWDGTRVLWCVCAALGIVAGLLAARGWGRFRSQNRASF